MRKTVFPPLYRAALLARVRLRIAKIERPQMAPTVAACLARVRVSIEHVVTEHADAERERDHAKRPDRLLCRWSRWWG